MVLDTTTFSRFHSYIRADDGHIQPSTDSRLHPTVSKTARTGHISESTNVVSIRTMRRAMKHFYYLITMAIASTSCLSFHLKIGMMERPPFFFRDDTDPIFQNKSQNETKYIGVSPLTLDWLSQKMNFTYTTVPIGVSSGSPILVNGSIKWNGATRWLVDKEIDLIITPLQLSSARAKDVDFAGLDVYLSVMVTPAPTERSPILSTIKPFTTTVWISVIISLLAMAICVSLTSIPLESFKWKKVFLIQNHVVYLAAILINQGEVFYNARFRFRASFRLACATWCLLCVVILNVYSGTLVSHITSRQKNKPPETMRQMFDEGKLTYLIISSLLAPELIASNKNDPEIIHLANLVRRHPEMMVKTSEVAIQRVASGCCAYHDTMANLEYHVMHDFKEHGVCRISLGNPISGYALFGIGVVKSHPVKDIINQRYLELRQTGLVDHWRTNFTGGQTTCYRSLLIRNRKPTKLRSLNLVDLGSAFFILGLGYLLSMLAFLLEQFRRYKPKSKAENTL